MIGWVSLTHVAHPVIERHPVAVRAGCHAEVPEQISHEAVRIGERLQLVEQAQDVCLVCGGGVVRDGPGEELRVGLVLKAARVERSGGPPPAVT